MSLQCRFGVAFSFIIDVCDRQTKAIIWRLSTFVHPTASKWNYGISHAGDAFLVAQHDQGTDVKPVFEMMTDCRYKYKNIMEVATFQTSE